MRIRNGVTLNPGEVVDARGGSGLGCLPFPILFGGGGTVLVLLAIWLIFSLAFGSCSGSSQASNDLASKCTTGAAANQNTDCRVVAVVNSVQDYWSTETPKLGATYTDAPTVLYTDQLNTGCGLATTEEGPFYCPNDKRVYLDLSFFNDLHTKLGAQGGEFAQAYVIAHEYGHHVQDLLGVFDKVGKPTDGATGSSVRLELQADCYAGVWAFHAQDTGVIENVTSADISDALNAAAAVGDDRIEKSESGQVKPDTFTHGTSDQRDRWFTRGYTNGNPADCDTFSAASL
jgi:predicted metalloprotease